jgi:hypothetical protein
MLVTQEYDFYLDWFRWGGGGRITLFDVYDQ